MTRDEYEQRKRRLNDQLRVGIEWLQTAHRQQVEALDLLWANDEEAGSRSPTVERRRAVPPPAALPLQASVRPRRRAWALYSEVQGVLPKVPEVFDRNHICEQLGYEPDRGSLYRTLEQLREEGTISRESRGAGRTTTRYRKKVAGSGKVET